MRINIPVENYETLVGHVKESDNGDKILSLAESFSYNAELVMASDSTEEQKTNSLRQMWNDETYKYFSSELPTTEIITSSIMLLINAWEHGAFFMTSILSTFERVVVAEIIVDFLTEVFDKNSKE